MSGVRKREAETAAPWKIAVVGTAENIHAGAGAMLRDLRYEGHLLQVLHARPSLGRYTSWLRRSRPCNFIGALPGRTGSGRMPNE